MTNMKIGTITFHWATNYGAVLQAYALQRSLSNMGYTAEIIDYVPLKVKIFNLLDEIRNLNFMYILKEIKINSFRKNYLVLSRRKYFSKISLERKCKNYDVYICGSDQIWNSWFLMNSEKRVNLSYFLGFTGNDKRKISYACSFGTSTLSPDIELIIKPELRKFKSIGVRENSGKVFIENMGLEAECVVDPTLLLDKTEYLKITKKSINLEAFTFSYILHKNQNVAQEIHDYVTSTYFQTCNHLDDKKVIYGIEEWLECISESRFVITNSFHAVIFSLIFHKDFLVVCVENMGINDRLFTLLENVCLSDRIVENFSTEKIDQIMNQPINWNNVDEQLSILKNKSSYFLYSSINS